MRNRCHFLVVIDWHIYYSIFEQNFESPIRKYDLMYAETEGEEGVDAVENETAYLCKSARSYG